MLDIEVEVEKLLAKHSVVFALDNISYEIVNTPCPGCFLNRESHYHSSLKSVSGGVEPIKHKGRQHMAELKDDRTIDAMCTYSADDYCYCTPSAYDCSAATRRERMTQYEVEWDPTISF